VRQALGKNALKRPGGLAEWYGEPTFLALRGRRTLAQSTPTLGPRLAGWLFVASGLLTVANNYLPGAGHLDKGVLNAIGAAALLLGALAFALPWDRFPARSSLAVVPFALGLIMLGNLYGGVGAYSYAIYFVLLFMWVGVTQPPKTAFLLAPLAVAAYVVPGLVREGLPAGSVSSVTVAIPVCLLVAETISRTVRRAARREAEYQRLAEASREAEEQFRLAFDNAPIGIALVAPDGTFLRVNRALCEIVGYPADALVTNTFQAITHPDDLEADLEYVRQVLAGEIRTYSMEKRYLHADGRLVWINLSVSLVRDDSGRPVHFISQIEDITDRKRTEETLKDRERQLAHAQAVAHVGSWNWDIAADHVTWSDELFRIYGLAPGEVEVTYDSFLVRVHPDDRDLVDGAVRRAHETGQPFVFEHRIVLPDGSVRWCYSRGEVVLASGTPTRMFGTAQDITDRKYTEARLRASEERTRRILETAGDAFVAIDQTGSINAWNRQAEATFGWTTAEVMGKPLDEVLIPPDLRDAHQQGIARFLATEWGPALDQRLELAALHRDGHQVPVEVVIWALQEDGQWTFNAFLRDITQRKAAQEELARLALVDDLTGLCNRRGLLAVAEPLTRVAQRDERDMALFYIDLDNMKEINDQYGHAAGDQALIKTAKLLVSTFRDSDIVARLGGDEFCVLLPRNGVEAQAVMDRLEENLQARGDACPPISLSVGVAKYNWDAPCSIDTLIERADAAMYQNKAAKRQQAR
jgi:diguanylate cyclase